VRLCEKQDIKVVIHGDAQTKQQNVDTTWRGAFVQARFWVLDSISDISGRWYSKVFRYFCTLPDKTLTQISNSFIISGIQ
jgi:hypothetical protein